MGDDFEQGEDISSLTNHNSVLYAIAVLTDLGWRYVESMKNGFSTNKDGAHSVSRQISEAILYEPNSAKFINDIEAVESQKWKEVKIIKIGVISTR